MSLLGTILGKIFPAGHPASTSGGGAPASPAGASASAPSGGASASAASPTPSSGTGGSGASQPAPAATQPVDVEAVLNALAQKSSQRLNWRTSIVDLMKLVGLDSSLESRKALARELNYTGDMNDSASMNIWLHKQVMKKIADNGGKVPEEMKH